VAIAKHCNLKAARVRTSRSEDHSAPVHKFNTFAVSFWSHKIVWNHKIGLAVLTSVQHHGSISSQNIYVLHLHNSKLTTRACWKQWQSCSHTAMNMNLSHDMYNNNPFIALVSPPMTLLIAAIDKYRITSSMYFRRNLKDVSVRRTFETTAH